MRNFRIQSFASEASMNVYRPTVICVVLLFFACINMYAGGGGEDHSQHDHEDHSQHDHGDHSQHDHAESVSETSDSNTIKILDDGFKEITVNTFVFRWRIVGQNIEFTMSAPTTGWVAVGFKPSFMMKDADFILAYVRNGEVFASDEFGTAGTNHQADTRLGGEDSITVLGGREVDEVTTIQIRRPLESSDPYDQTLIPGETLKIIFAWSAADNFTSIHRNRGSFVIEL